MSDPFISEEDFLGYRPMSTLDSAYWMLEKGLADAAEGKKGWITETTVYNSHCYICRDPEFALMGLPLCYPCTFLVDGVECGKHVPADDSVCDEGHDMHEWYETSTNS